MLPALTSGHIAGIVVRLLRSYSCGGSMQGAWSNQPWIFRGAAAGQAPQWWPERSGNPCRRLFNHRHGSAGLPIRPVRLVVYPGGRGWPCAVLALGLARRLHESALETAPQYLVSIYGERIGPIASVFSSAGIYLNIIAQGLSAVALAYLHIPY